jgi:predicted aspartyl protease
MPKTECGFITIAGGASGKDLLTFYGPTIFVDIGFDAAFKPDQTHAPIPGMSGIRALVDSGATESCIDSVLAAQLNLPIIDRKTFSGIGGKHEVNIHLAQVRVPSLNVTLYGAFAGVHLEAGGQWHKALIGRTFLQNYTMTYNGRTGSVTLSSD